MAYQSKTYSLSDEVINAIEAARKRGLTPNKYLRGLVLLAAATDAGEYTTLDSVLMRPNNEEQFKKLLQRVGSTPQRRRGKVTRETRGGKR